MSVVLALLKAYWKEMLIAIAIAVVYFWIHGLYSDRAEAIKERDKVTAEHAKFVAEVNANGIAAQKRAERIKAADIAAKGKSDAELTKARADAVTANAGWMRLAAARAAGGYMPPTAPNSTGADGAEIIRAKYERALGYIDEQGAKLSAEGDAPRVGLDNAKEWAQNRGSGH